MSETTTPKSPLAVAAVQLGLLVLAIYAAFIGGQTAQGIYDDHWRGITLFLAAGLVAVWLVVRLARRQGIPATPLDGPLLLLLLSGIVSTLFSVTPTYSRESLVFGVGYLFFYYISADLGRRGWLRELTLNAILGVAGLVWMLGLLQLSWWAQGKLPQAGPGLPRLSVLGNPNTMAGFIALVMPVALYKLTAARSHVARGLLALWVVLLVVSALLTNSRGGLLGLAAAVGLWLLIWQAQRVGWPELGRRFRRWWPALAVGLAALLLLGGWLAQARSVGGAVSVRRQVLLGALDTWATHPLFGSGPGTLGQEMLRTRQPGEQIWADAHNLYLTVTAETGLFGAIGLVWLLIVAGHLLWQTLRRRAPADWDMAGLACAASLVGFAVHNLLDSMLKFPLMLLLVAVLAGFWMSDFARERQRGAVGLAAAALVLLAVVTFAGWRDVQHIAAYNRAVEAAQAGNWPGAVAHLREAAERAPDVSFYRRQLGFAAGVASLAESAYRIEAIENYRAALQVVNRLAADHANLACLLQLDGQPEAAAQEMVQAAQLSPGGVLPPLPPGQLLPDVQSARYATEVARRRPLPAQWLGCAQ